MKTSEELILTAAQRFIAYREKAKALRAKRGESLCERERHEIGDGVELVPCIIDAVPCWKATRPCAPDDYEPIPRQEWCESCVARQGWHEQYRAAAASRGAWLRILTQRVKAEVLP